MLQKPIFFDKAAPKMMALVDSWKYKNVSSLIDRILYHTRHGLLFQEIDNHSHIPNVFMDLSASNSCILITGVHSPVKYTVIAKSH